MDNDSIKDTKSSVPNTNKEKSTSKNKKLKQVNKEALLQLNSILQQDKPQPNKLKLCQDYLSDIQDFYKLLHSNNTIKPVILNGECNDKTSRIIPPSMFSLPSTPYYTTLTKNGNEIKEVIHKTIQDDDDLKQRPLQGNLTSKLREYTRGQVGSKSKPFVVKGLKEDADEIRGCGDDNLLGHDKESASNARRVLDIGVVDAYKSGILLTSPPGLIDDSIVGIRYEDVYGNETVEDIEEVIEEQQPIEKAKTNAADASNMWEDFSSKKKSSHMIEEQQPIEKAKTNAADASNMWEDFFLEEDSLFGSDDSESISSEEEEVSLEEEELEVVEPVEQEKVNEITNEQNNNEDELIMNEDEIDFLLDIQNTTKLSKKLTKQTTLSSKNQITTWAITSSIYIPNNNFEALLPNPAQIYPFELDTFQKQAVLRLERNQSVFLSAHTSAGKTVVAEYAISLSLKHCTRAIYTSPIKALSNQKYRDFQEKFGSANVGLITGDVQVNPDATCLVMTTEILRSMLYRGADLIRDVEWVIFDEVHYINDIDRGVVWEEVIIMLPDYVQFVFLSATTPNTMDFSDWIGRTKQKFVHVIKTDYRPVPLSHYLFAGGKLHKIMEGGKAKRYLEKGWQDANKALTTIQDQKQQGKQQPSSQRNSSNSWYLSSGNKQNWISLIKFLSREGLMPTVIFSFSKKKCEEIATMLHSQDLNTAAEKNATKAFIKQTIARLSPIDAKLPQVISVCELVMRGIGVHHGGLLPILKEMVEILFSKNLIKVLFATETFAMGVNMPAKAVVFTSVRKHDGMQFRILQPGEYTQMAGRAGRRGLDKVGTVILCCFGDVPPPNLLLKNMLTGSSHKLTSRFRLTYNMILNLLRVEDMTVEGMIKRSFSEFQTQRALITNQYPNLLKRGIKTLEKLEYQFELERSLRIGCEDIEEYYLTSKFLLQEINAKLYNYLFSKGGLTGEGSFVPGRVLLVTNARKKGFVCAPALLLKPPIVTSSEDATNKPAIGLVLLPESYVFSAEINTLIDDSNKKVLQEGDLNYVGCANHRYYGIYEIHLNEIVLITSIKYKIDAKLLYNDNSSSSGSTASLSAKQDLSNPFANAKSLGRQDNDPFANFAPSRGKKDSSSKKTSKSSESINQVINYLIEANITEKKEGLPSLNLRDCIKNLSNEGNTTLEFRATCDQMESYLSELRSMSSHTHPSLEKHYVTVERKETLRTRVKYLQHSLSNQSLRLFPDFLQRKALLNTLRYIDDNDIVCLKGRVACEVNTCEELIITEMIFEGLFNNLHPTEIVAALSALVFQEKTNEEDDCLLKDLPENLINCCQSMKDIALNLGILQQNHGITIDPYEYITSCLKFGLVHVVYEWACGIPFYQICDLTMVQEGSIVRCITRLDELCRDVRNCARVVGNPTLYRKMEDASVLIKRDIVFATSLYVG